MTTKIKTTQQKRWRRAKAFLTIFVPVVPEAEAKELTEQVFLSVDAHLWETVTLSPQKIFPICIRMSPTPLAIHCLRLMDQPPNDPMMLQHFNPVATAIVRRGCQRRDLEEGIDLAAGEHQDKLLVFGDAIIIPPDYPVMVDMMPIGKNMNHDDIGDLITGAFDDLKAAYSVSYRNKRWYFVTALLPLERPETVSEEEWIKMKEERRVNYDRARFAAALAIPEH
jgi:hypothetical protein